MIYTYFLTSILLVSGVVRFFLIDFTPGDKMLPSNKRSSLVKIWELSSSIMVSYSELLLLLELLEDEGVFGVDCGAIG